MTWRRRRGSRTLPAAECSALLSPSAPVASRPRTARTRPETAGRRRGLPFCSAPCRSRALTRSRRHLRTRHYGGRGLTPSERPLRGLLSRNCTGGACGRGRRARVGGEGRGPRRHKAHSCPRDPALCDAGARNRNQPREREKPSASKGRGTLPRGPAHRAVLGGELRLQQLLPGWFAAQRGVRRDARPTALACNPQLLGAPQFQ